MKRIHIYTRIDIHTISSTMTPRKPLYSQLMGESEQTLPETVTTRGNTLDAVSSNCAENIEI